ncbi:hypothetical protein SCAR479_07232 [Seiridium cardinale]|uniref:Uncharacterized protein n=1 Tax=Seiridium cardinale TaxID=138064 RepID=A0ABR2XQH4_9PEZI
MAILIALLITKTDHSQSAEAGNASASASRVRQEPKIAIIAQPLDFKEDSMRRRRRLDSRNITAAQRQARFESQAAVIQLLVLS